jgi:hypothetical protein
MSPAHGFEILFDVRKCDGEMELRILPKEFPL